MSRIRILKQSITEIKADAVVNAANEGLHQGGGVCGYIFAAAGPSTLTEACRKIGHCDTGSAVITPAFEMYNTKYIIHAVGPVWYGGKNHEEQLLHSCYTKALELAAEHQLHSIAFPLISSGIFGYPREEAWKCAIKACMAYIKTHEAYHLDVYFAVLDDAMKQLGEKVLSSVVKAYSLIGIFEDTAERVKEDPVLIENTDRSKRKTMLYLKYYEAAGKRMKAADISLNVVNDRTYSCAELYARSGKRLLY